MPLLHTHSHTLAQSFYNDFFFVVVLKILLRPDLDKCFYNSRKSGLNNLIKKWFRILLSHETEPEVSFPILSMKSWCALVLVLALSNGMDDALHFTQFASG